MTKNDIKQIEKAIDALYKVETMELMQEEMPLYDEETLEVGKYTNLAEFVGVSGAIDKLNKYLSIVELNELNNGGLELQVERNFECLTDDIERVNNELPPHLEGDIDEINKRINWAENEIKYNHMEHLALKEVYNKYIRYIAESDYLEYNHETAEDIKPKYKDVENKYDYNYPSEWRPTWAAPKKTAAKKAPAKKTAAKKK